MGTIYESDRNFCPLRTSRAFPMCRSNCMWAVYDYDIDTHVCAVAQLAANGMESSAINSVAHREVPDVEQ